MPQPSPAVDLVELTRRSMQDTNRRDYDTAMSVFAADAVFDMSAAGLGCFEGLPAVRGYLEDWIGAYEVQEFTEWHGEDLGNGVVFVVALLEGRLAGSRSSVQERWAFTIAWADGRIARVVASQEIERARAAAERLARGGR